jgi:hypothetical protein
MMLGANNQPVEILEIGGRRIEVDVEIAPIVAALNAAGVETKASCSGHSYRPATIALGDGRWIVVAKDMAEFKMIEALFPTDINGNTRPLTGGVTEVTDAMIEAGVAAQRKELFGYYVPDIAVQRAAVEAIYLAMSNASRGNENG